MAFDFMKNFTMFEDDERFGRLCESIEEAIRDTDQDEEKVSDAEIMQALDLVGFNLFRDSWEEFKKMELTRDTVWEDPAKGRGKRLIN